VDFAAYALLRRERPVASKRRYGLDKAFDLLYPILVREATRKDSEVYFIGTLLEYQRSSPVRPEYFENTVRLVSEFVREGQRLLGA